ncbi:MAG: zf-HC2 domain-containing protein [Eubacterium sp.]|nr:zf-HC2 domain-containing protein [Eubacterium sp.]
MNHLEAQSYIMPFIEGTLPESKNEDFFIHMNSCPKCREELEIYYTLIVGMKQIDNKQEVATDFSADLDRNLKKLEHKYRGRRRIKFSAFSIVMISLIFSMFIFYGRALARVYDFEQDKKRESQGQYYFSRELSKELLIPEKDMVKISDEINAEPEISFFMKIYNFDDISECEKLTGQIGLDIFDEREVTEEDTEEGEKENEENTPD